MRLPKLIKDTILQSKSKAGKYNLYSGAPGAPLFFCAASGKQNVIMSIFLFSNNGFTLSANYCKIQGKR